jgi:adenine-specific DNA-methyltransferase
MLAEAVCKLEGFQYAPSDTIYWQHGHSTERDFIYVTTAHLGHDQLQQLSDEVGPERTLLVPCTAFRAKADLDRTWLLGRSPRLSWRVANGVTTTTASAWRISPRRNQSQDS